VRRQAIILAAALSAFSALAGCTGRQAQQDAPGVTHLETRPLASLAAQPMIVLPMRYLRGGDPMGWANDATRRELLALVDTELQRILAERGVGSDWRFPADLARAAQRNPGIAPDPYMLAAEALRGPNARRGDRLTEPFASQVRTLIAFHDGRLVLYPLELRFEPVDGGQGRAVLRVAVLDARRSEINWIAEIGSEPASAYSPALAVGIARVLADLIVESSNYSYSGRKWLLQ
jgi:hypothetical protein